MNRNKKGVMPEITREIYKNVKKIRPPAVHRVLHRPV